MNKIISLQEKRLENLDASILKTKSIIEKAKSTLKESELKIKRHSNSLDEDELDFIKHFNLQLENILHSSTKLLNTLTKIRKRKIN